MTISVSRTWAVRLFEPGVWLVVRGTPVCGLNLERYTLVIQSLLLFGRHDAILFLGACQQFDEQYPGTQTRTRKEPKPFNNPATLFHVFHFTSPTLPHRYPRPHLFGHTILRIQLMYFFKNFL